MQSRFGLHVDVCDVVNLLEFSLNFIVIRLLFKPFLLEEIFKVVHFVTNFKNEDVSKISHQCVDRFGF